MKRTIVLLDASLICCTISTLARQMSEKMQRDLEVATNIKNN